MAGAGGPATVESLATEAWREGAQGRRGGEDVRSKETNGVEQWPKATTVEQAKGVRNIDRPLNKH